MKKVISLILIMLTVISLTALSSCSYELDHIHKWSSYYDNGDGTHYRFCLKDASHTESSGHEFGEPVTLIKATENKCGKIKKTCRLCGYSETETVEPEGEHVFDKCIASDEYLCEKLGRHTAIYYKSCECGAYGSEDYTFEYSDIDPAYSEVEYIRSDGNSYIDTGLPNDYLVSYSPSSDLPDGYTLLDYIESDGQSYINTGVVSRADVKLTMDFEACSCNAFLFGARDTFDSDDSFGIYIASETDLWLRIGNNDTRKLKLSVPSTLGRFSMSASGTGLTYGDSSVSFDNTLVSGSTEICLFAMNEGTGPDDRMFEGKIYSCKIYYGENIIRDFVPCRKVLSMETGMYDKITGKFYGSCGEGNFTPGTMAAVTPSGSGQLPGQYRETEYIESDGLSYIDSGLKVDYYDRAEYETDIEITSKSGSGTGYMGCNRYLQLSDEFFNINEKKHVKLEWENGYLKTYHDDALVLINDFTGEDRGEITAGIFSLGNENDVWHTTRLITGRVYSLSITVNDFTERDFIPCVNTADGEPGLYDTVYNKFYGNSGEGHLTAGPYAQGESESRYREYSSLVSSGGAFLELDYKPNEKTKIVSSFMSADTAENQTFFYGAGADYADNFLEAYPWGNIMCINFGYSGHNFGSIKNGDTVNIIQSSEINAFSEGDNVYGNSSSGSVFTAPNNLTIFALNRSTGLFNSVADVATQGIKIYESDVLIYDLVPACDILGGEAGLYDKENRKFYGNCGGGSLTAEGAKDIISGSGEIIYYEKEDLGSDYTQLTYIESSGDTYLDTGIPYESGSEYSVEVTAEYTVLGSYTQLMGFAGTEGLSFGAENGQVFGDSSHSLSVDCPYTAEFTMEKNYVYSSADGSVKIWPRTDGGSNHNFLLLGAYESPESSAVTNYCHMKLYSAKIYVNGTLERDYIPVVSNVTGRAGMYDLVNDTFIFSDKLKAGSATEININTDNINLLYNDGYCNNKLSQGLITYCCVTDGSGNVVRDYVPVVRNSDGQAGLYDMVSGEFYGSSSSCCFTAGSFCSHKLPGSETVREATYCESGYSESVCSLCGSTVRSMSERTAYKGIVITDIEGISLSVYKGSESSEISGDNICLYSVNNNTLNYSRVNCEIVFSINLPYECEYTVYSCGELIEENNGIYTIKDIDDDIYIYICRKS